MNCFILPPYLVAKTKPKQLIKDAELRSRRNTFLQYRTVLQGQEHEEIRRLFDSKNTYEFPARPIKTERQQHSTEASNNPTLQMANIIYDHFHDSLNRESWDNKNSSVDIYINFGQDYDNAFWDGEHLVFGNGDGKFFNSFLILDIVAHEYAHAVTDTTAKLVYQDQSGALNEHFSDVVGISIKHLFQDATNQPKNWLLGEGLFNASLNARGLRDMEKPGTAYDDPTIGKDPQPDHMSDYYDGTEDNGGVHLNSGIPNRAFAIFCNSTKLKSYDLPMAVWYQSLLESNENTNFAEFADLTIKTLSDFYKSDSATIQKLALAWATVGIEVSEVEPIPEPDKPAPRPTTPSRQCCQILRKIKQLLRETK